MTQYLFSVMHDYVNNPPTTDPAEMEKMFASVGAFNASIRDKIVFMGGLEAPDTATAVQIRDGAPIVTDGPFAESKEMIGGVWVIEAADLDEALALATRATQACGAPVEVRPFQGI